jgi:hypothetical protein
MIVVINDRSGSSSDSCGGSSGRSDGGDTGYGTCIGENGAVNVVIIGVTCVSDKRVLNSGTVT